MYHTSYIIHTQEYLETDDGVFQETVRGWVPARVCICFCTYFFTCICSWIMHVFVFLSVFLLLFVIVFPIIRLHPTQALERRDPPISLATEMGKPGMVWYGMVSLATEMGKPESLLPLFKRAHKPTEWSIKETLS